MANGRERDKRREVQWRRVVREQGRSGLSIRDFCRRSKVPESAFHFWRRELERRDLQPQAEQEQRQRPTMRARPRRPAAAPPAFVPVRVAEEVRTDAARIEIVLCGGRRIQVTAPVDRQALTEVLAVLEGRPC
jgi:transposase-like protein